MYCCCLLDVVVLCCCVYFLWFVFVGVCVRGFRFVFVVVVFVCVVMSVVVSRCC